MSDPQQPTPTEESSSFVKVCKGFYLCQNRLGFHEALVDFSDGQKNIESTCIEGAPDKFPCLVTIDCRHFNRPVIVVNSVPLEKLTKGLEAFQSLA